MSKMKVMGHFPPDTDTTCSPIVYAWYLSNYKDTPAEAVIGGSLNKETTYVLNKFEVETPEIISELTENDQVFIIDTNNPEELLPGYDKATITGLIDHHKLTGGLSTPNPIPITIKIYGCSATIVWEEIRYEVKDEAPKWVFGLLLSCIISDTLKGASPTTSQDDIDAMNELAELAGLNLDEYADELFAAKSDLSGMSADDILLADSKSYEINGKMVRFSVLETAKPDNVVALREELITGINGLKEKDNTDFIFMFAIDIIKEEATAIVATDEEKEIISKAFDANYTGDTVILPGVVSRKKQIIPSIEPLIS
ncbi:manganese-dependent inorganic pyrophosphatase [Candidatus Dojkabacteria bacterium]|uniref:inorganic diphosphatase n=1 Tax=Candidatus Dojkabacteria bacterium TaxID=2099670 RepID=A0A955L5I9_9BACT|nr:manganese-dependent inorganic pyrophosphatase [Candidatus Dojkabacteria bacterium]